MASARSVAPLIAVFCLTEVPANVLTTFLEQAYSAVPSSRLRYTFIASDDPNAPLEPANPPVTSPIRGPTDSHQAGYHLQKLEEAGREDVNLTHFVFLDHHSLKQGRGCVLGGLLKEEGSMNLVRSQFSTSLLALQALETDKTWPDLWLDAALAGSVIPGSTASDGYRSFTERPEIQASIDAINQRELQEEDNHKDQPFAVFCSANIPIEILNELLTESEHPGHEDDENGLCILSTLDPNSATATTKGTLQTFTSPFIGKDLAWILDFVNRKLPDSSLDNHSFLVLDEHTLANSSVLHVNGKGEWNAEQGTDLHLGFLAARQSFRTAFHTIGPDNGPMSEYVNGAALNGGVYDF